MHHVVDAINATPSDAAFDAAWMTATFEAFWADHGAATVKFNNGAQRVRLRGDRWWRAVRRGRSAPLVVVVPTPAPLSSAAQR